MSRAIKRFLGFTLIEALISLGLIGLMLGVVATLVSGYSMTMRRINGSVLDTAALREALEAVAADVQFAMVVDRPADGTTSTDVSLQRVDVLEENRLPNPLPNPLPTTLFLPRDTSKAVPVVYYVKEGGLWSRTTYPDGFEDWEIVPTIQGLSSSRPGRSITITLSALDESRTPPRLLTLTTGLMLP